MSTGRVDLCARGRSWYNPTPTGSISLPVAYQVWCVETAFSLFGTIGAQVKEGVCGAPIVDEDGPVGGLSMLVDEAGMWAHTPALDFLISSGWSVVWRMDRHGSGGCYATQPEEGLIDLREQGRGCGRWFTGKYLTMNNKILHHNV